MAAGAALGWAAPALAQNFPPGAIVQPLPDPGAAAELRRHLSTLAENPRSVTALVGAGRAALTIGDYQTALTFFARAEEVAPRDARVRAGMASALVHLEQPSEALRLFGEAVALGAPEAEIAGDRGLAYDAVGDQGRAQQDYALSLRNRENGEIRRRLALSLAISGQRDAALQTIADQLARNDRAAWRTRAFILALSGDAAGAQQSAQAMMPAPAVAALAPFFARLPALTPAQRAQAVHFGRFPVGGGTQYAGTPQAAVPPVPQPGPQARQPAVAQQPAPSPGRQERRRNVVERLHVPHHTETPAPAAQQPQVQQPAPQQPADMAQVQTQPASPQQQATAQQVRPQPQGEVRTFNLPPSRVQEPQPQVAARPQTPQAQPAPQSEAERPDFDDVAELVSRLPTEEARPAPATRPQQRPPAQQQRPPAAPQAQARTATDNAAPAAGRTQRPAAPRTQTPAEAHPSRHWVQIAGGADRNALPREFARIREQAPQLFRNRQAHVTPLRATNRLLVGPFATVEAAQEFVNQLARQNLTAFTWTSPAGQEIERLATR